MGSPAASADVHVAGRRPFDRRSNMAPDPARGAPLSQCASYSSYRVQLSRLSISAWRSPSASWPPSIGVVPSKGYGPGSLSSAYSKRIGISEWLLSTTVHEKPYGARPKSGCSFLVAARPLDSQAALCGWTGRAAMSAFHTLSAGKTVQFGAPGGVAASATGV